MSLLEMRKDRLQSLSLQAMQLADLYGAIETLTTALMETQAELTTVKQEVETLRTASAQQVEALSTRIAGISLEAAVASMQAPAAPPTRHRQLSIRDLPAKNAPIPNPPVEMGAESEPEPRRGSVYNLGKRGEERIDAVYYYLLDQYGLEPATFDYNEVADQFEVSPRRAREYMQALSERGLIRPMGSPKQPYARIQVRDTLAR